MGLAFNFIFLFTIQLTWRCQRVSWTYPTTLVAAPVHFPHCFVPRKMGMTSSSELKHEGNSGGTAGCTAPFQLKNSSVVPDFLGQVTEHPPNLIGL